MPWGARSPFARSGEVFGFGVEGFEFDMGAGVAGDVIDVGGRVAGFDEFAAEGEGDDVGEEDLDDAFAGILEGEDLDAVLAVGDVELDGLLAGGFDEVRGEA